MRRRSGWVAGGTILQPSSAAAPKPSPFLTGYFLQALSLPLWILVVAAALAGTGGVQIALSRWIKTFRRGAPLSALQFADGRTEPTRILDLIARPQRTLKLIVYTVDLLAIALLTKRLLSE